MTASNILTLIMYILTSLLSMAENIPIFSSCEYLAAPSCRLYAHSDTICSRPKRRVNYVWRKSLKVSLSHLVSRMDRYGNIHVCNRNCAHIFTTVLFKFCL